MTPPQLVVLPPLPVPLHDLTTVGTAVTSTCASCADPFKLRPVAVCRCVMHGLLPEDEAAAWVRANKGGKGAAASTPVKAGAKRPACKCRVQQRASGGSL
jgi:hypothetical protein